MNDDFKREHPSYGMLQISRMHNSSVRRLFGSALDAHYNTIRMTVSRAQWTHSLHEDRYFGMNKDHIEIEMSAAQFAEAITSLNMGGGTPCTVRYIGGKPVDEPPDYPTEVEYVKEKFADNLQDMIATMKQRRKEIEELTASLPAKRKQALKIALDVMIQQVTSNVPFVLEQFHEATTRVVTSAKAEVESFVSHAVHSAGLQAIAGGSLPPLLGAGKEDEE